MGASSATAGSFALVAQGDSILQVGLGQTETFDVWYFGSAGDPDVFGLNLRVIFSTQFSVVNPSASAEAVFESPVSLILTPGLFDPPDLFGVEIGGAQISGVGIPFPVGGTLIGQIVLEAVAPGGVDLFLDPDFTRVIDANLDPIGAFSSTVLLGSVVVPEPSSMLMLGMALGALAFVRRRA